MTKKCHRILYRRKAWSGLSWLVALFLLAGQLPLAAKAEVTLFAAASVAPALTRIIDDLNRNAGADIRLSPAASSVLSRQIQSGAPADIVVLANPQWMNWLEDRNLIHKDSRADLLENRLALLTRKDASLPADPEAAILAALKSGRIAMADPDHVPAGIYGKTTLQALGLWSSIRTQLAHSPNAPAAVALLARGEVSAAISYQSDARLSDRVKVQLLFPEHLHAPIRYQIALVDTGGKLKDAAVKLYDYLLDRDRNSVWKSWGFLPAAGS